MNLPLHWRMLIALVAAVAIGTLFGDSELLLKVCNMIGTLFLNALKMLIVPLILAALLNGLIGGAEQGGLGRLGALTFGFYIGTGLLAILTGLAWANLLTPGIVDGVPAAPLLGLSGDANAIVAQVQEKGTQDLWAVLIRMVPTNPIQAAATGDMLGLVTFGLLFGWALSQLPGDLRGTHAAFWKGVYEAMTRITALVMKAAPIGVFAIVTGTVAKTGTAALEPLAVFMLVVVLGLLTHGLVVLPLVLKLVARVPAFALHRAMVPALLTAFSTSSSNATLPLTMDCIENKAKVPRRVSGFVLPIGANVNTDGSALYECVAAIFIAQAYGLHLSFGAQFTVVALALITAVGVAGIPSASLVAIAVILSAIGLPLEGVGLILAVDRVLDMCRTALNVLGDSSATVTVARLSGEDGVLGQPALKVAGKRD
ncbi:MAG: dicarboxylate/amino acid:cation symporter [Stagnimonas sp.]|nr:dicarboxylate/amino acid:cation symporter [Stagnimonas sp.]